MRAAVMGVLMPLHLRRRTGFWWQILEVLMELAAPYQVSTSLASAISSDHICSRCLPSQLSSAG